jgi:hypothetical protein
LLRFDALRQRLVLTPEEKRVIVFVLIALILGLATKHYRDTHPQAPAKIDKKHPHSSAERSPLSPSSSSAKRRTSEKFLSVCCGGTKTSAKNICAS